MTSISTRPATNSYYQTQIGQDYYDEVADAKDRQDYYAPIVDTFKSTDGRRLFNELHDLLSTTYRPLNELPGDVLYSKVDRRPDGALYTLYGGEGPKNEVQVKERNTRDLQGYNLEHVVPKAWFDAQKPMRDDLHHLFTEDRQVNSDRGDLPLRDARSSGGGVIDTPHGKSFQPHAGKGEAARAILYFVTRHPGLVGDQKEELTAADLPTLLEWNRSNPVTDYERHRNESIQDEQGNRNPFIDFPELAERVDFRLGFGPVENPGLK